MHYTIEVSYTTGDSFHTEERTEILDYVWHSLDMCEASLDRLKNHYEYYQKYCYSMDKVKNPLPVGVGWDKEWRLILLEFISDTGKTFNYSPSWCGYFECLHSAQVKLIGKEYTF